MWDYCDVVASATAPEPLVEEGDFQSARWFAGAQLNFAENLLRRRDEATALVAVREDGSRQALSYAELHRATARVAAELRDRGVGPGDRVAALLPNAPEAVVCMLATASIGGVWSSCSPDFGVAGALDRFGQIEPKLLVACRQYDYGGKTFDVAAKAEAIRAEVAAIEGLLWTEDIGRIVAERREEGITFEQRDFDDPLYILYSSGTTGKPKCIVHGVGGTLLQHLKEHRLHVGLTPNDTLFYFTTCGWMMWNWLVSGLASDCTLVLYDGSPFHPKPPALMDLIDAEAITVFGTSAKYLTALGKARVVPRASHDLSSLRTILSTGSPLTHENFRDVYRSFPPDIALASISGGTDIVSCFALGNPMSPVYAGELQGKGLGMAVEVFDQTGAPLPRGKGELVCTKSFPSRPIGFWNDPDGAKYRGAYFERFPGVWAHGDFAEFTEHGGMIVHGRSDAVLNPGGVRIGTAEIYRQVESIDAVVEAVCVGQDWRDDMRIVLFVVLREGLALDADLAAEIRARIRTNASPRHVPAIIEQVADIPRTMSGKIAELAVRDVIHGRAPGNVAALSNPEALALFECSSGTGDPEDGPPADAGRIRKLVAQAKTAVQSAGKAAAEAGGAVQSALGEAATKTGEAIRSAANATADAARSAGAHAKKGGAAAAGQARAFVREGAAGAVAGLGIAGEALAAFLANLDWTTIPAGYVTKFATAGTRGISRSLDEARLVWETLPENMRALGPERLAEQLSGFDWSHRIPHSAGGGNEASNGIFELASVNRARGAQVMMPEELRKAQAVLSHTAFRAALTNVASRAFKGALAGAAVAAVLAGLELGPPIPTRRDQQGRDVPTPRSRGRQFRRARGGGFRPDRSGRVGLPGAYPHRGPRDGTPRRAGLLRLGWQGRAHGQGLVRTLPRRRRAAACHRQFPASGTAPRATARRRVGAPHEGRPAMALWRRHRQMAKNRQVAHGASPTMGPATTTASSTPPIVGILVRNSAARPP